VATLEQVFSEHASFVWRVVGAMGIGNPDREDVVQEIFLVVRKLLPTYEERGAMRPWLSAIARRVVGDHRGRAYERREIAHAAPPVDATNPTGRLEARSSLKRVEQALERLGADQREVFMLYEVEGLTMPEIAEALGVPLQTCYSRLHAARDRMLAEFRADSP
jgi:RNA polymerase sigma-70 factor (ECF subfamily)